MMRILVVDDDVFAAEMTAAVLEDAGYETVIVENGVAAVERLAADVDFSVVVSDMNMPLVSGLELFETLRAEECNLPFILLSGDDPVKLRQLEPRLDACLAKDADLESTLPAAVANVVATRA